MVANPTTTQAAWLCLFLLLSLVQAYRPFDLNHIKRDNPGSFNIKAYKNVNVKRSGPLAKIKALAKYGVAVPDSMADFSSEKGMSMYCTTQLEREGCYTDISPSWRRRRLQPD